MTMPSENILFFDTRISPLTGLISKTLLCGYDLSAEGSDARRASFDPRLPAIPARPERRHDIGIQPDFDRLFRDFLLASYWATATASDNLFWCMNPRKFASLSLSQRLAQSRQRLARILFDCAGLLCLRPSSSVSSCFTPA